MLRRVRVLAAVALAAALPVAGLTPAAASVPWERSTPVAPRSVAAHQPQATDLTITVDSAGRVHLPATLKARRYTFAVTTTAEYADLQLARPFPGYTRTEFLHDLAHMSSRRSYGRLSRLARFAGGTDAFKGWPGSFTTTLHPGTYWAFSGLSDLATPSDVRRIRVVGRAPATTFPHVAGIVRVSDRGFTAPRRLPAGGELLVGNKGKRPHLAVLVQLMPGKTIADFKRSLVADVTSPVTTGVSAGSGVVGADTSFVWRYDLPPGDYVLADFYLRADGTPNAVAGLVRSVTLR